jgi:hypothetical protein
VPRPGQPRSERDAALLERFDAWMQLPIVVSAILPLVIIPESNGWVGVVVGVVTWLVFLVDYVTRARHLEHYGRTRLGRFDPFVVIATAPWFPFPGAQAGQFVVLLRLARLARQRSPVRPFLRAGGTVRRTPSPENRQSTVHPRYQNCAVKDFGVCRFPVTRRGG